MADPRSPPTRPGALRDARRRHQATQARRDALVRLRDGETVEVSAYPYNGDVPEPVRVRPLSEGEPLSGQNVLCLHNRRLRVLCYYVKDGEAVGDAYHGHAVHPPYKDIFGAVEEVY